MPPSASAARHNQLLASLKAADLALLRPALRPVELPLMTVLEEAGEPVKDVYFFQSGFASVVTGDKIPIEIGLIGREGMTGLCIVMHDDRSVNRTFMQAGGTALTLSADRLRMALLDSPSLRASLLRYTHAFTVQTSQTALVNGRAKIEARLARWLLMAHDRFDHAPFPFTHNFIAMMLGVRRPGSPMRSTSSRAITSSRRGAGRSRSSIARAWRRSPTDPTASGSGICASGWSRVAQIGRPAAGGTGRRHETVAAGLKRAGELEPARSSSLRASKVERLGTCFGSVRVRTLMPYNKTRCRLAAPANSAAPFTRRAATIRNAGPRSRPLPIGWASRRSRKSRDSESPLGPGGGAAIGSSDA